MPPLPQAFLGYRTYPRRLLIAACLSGAFLMGTGCEIHDEQVQSGSVTVGEQRLLPSHNGTARQIVNHDAPTSIEYVEDYAAGLERASTSGRPLVIICRASWCRWCAGLSQGVLADPDVVQRSSRCVCVTLDADRDADVCRRLGVRGFPTVILQTPDGLEVKRLTGRSEVRSLAAAIDEATARLANGPSPAGTTSPLIR